MLLFCETSAENLLGVAHSGLRGVSLRTSLPEAPAGERVLVIDGGRVPGPLQEQEGAVSAEFVPPAAILNLNPYLPPRPVTAAGGYVLRAGPAEPEVLLIFRRGVWDLPKGKLDEGETVEQCALREVQEEVGIGELHLIGEAGTTVHGYEEKSKYRVKTTYWYFMHTPQERFTPQAAEGIEQVAWMPWSEAETALGFDSLRSHMREIREAALLAVEKMGV